MVKSSGEYKAMVFDKIDCYDSQLIDISDTIHQNPEVGLEEYQACQLLTSRAEELGFEVDTGVAGLETAFVARYEGKKKGLVLLF